MAEPTRCDLIIRNAYLLTLDERRSVYRNGAVAIAGHAIAGVGPEAEILARFSAARVMDARGAIVHPGFIDAHLHINAHSCRGLFRLDPAGAAAGPANFADWKAALTPEDEHAAAAQGCLELLRHGVTAFLEPGSAFEPDAVAAAAEAVGVRCSLADPYLWDEPDIMEHIGGLKSAALFDRVPPTRERALNLLGGQLWRNREPDGLLHAHISLYGEGTASDELQRAAKALADAHEVVFNAHLGFSIEVAEAMERRLRGSRLEHLFALGVLGRNTTLVHMNVIRDADIAPILQSGLSIVWCPHAYLDRGTPQRFPTRLPELRQHGVPVAIGTDSARHSTVGDAGALAYHLAVGIGRPLSPATIIEMRTIDAARAIGLAHLIGSLEPGKRADLVIRAADQAEMQPGLDPLTQLALIGHGPSADLVIVNGRIVLRQGRSTRVDERAVFTAARTSTHRLLDRLNLPSPTEWPAL